MTPWGTLAISPVRALDLAALWLAARLQRTGGEIDILTAWCLDQTIEGRAVADLESRG